MYIESGGVSRLEQMKTSETHGISSETTWGSHERRRHDR